VEKLEKRISYLRGLSDGIDLEENGRDGQILSEVVQLLDDMVGEIRALHARVEEAEEYTEAIDEDLSDLEWLLYDDEDLYEDVDDDDAVEYEFDDDDEDEYDEYYDLDDDEDAYVFHPYSADDDDFDTSYEFECPSCQEVIFFREGVDRDGYHHYVIEPYPDDRAPINPT